ncbi:hypothetical protein XA68_14762 [Ophiocordyceps unilateralis]|uniref:Enoyl-CoA hydratase n=1 Tax=Ophiocordyceps unilateralis TaxID=268505 RepID=A0A2A9P9P1_OPHUN|nr:hypothetical protein XA68_14762 [Ophiocordyceps unilateralis]
MPPPTTRLRLRLRLRPRQAFLHPPLRRAYSSSEPLLLTRNVETGTSTGHVRLIEINRPEARNALSVALVGALRREFHHVAAQYDAQGRELDAVADQGGPTRALVIASAADACFCAGADLKERRGFTPQQTADFLSDLRSTFDALSDLPIPTISAISSLALGGGLELALCTHLRVMTTNAHVGLPETRLAIIPGAGGTHRLTNLVGRARARDLILTGRRVSAQEAYFIGLADRLVELPSDSEGQKSSSSSSSSSSTSSSNTDASDPRLLSTARLTARAVALRLAQEICQGGPVAVRAAIEAVAAASPLTETDMYRRVVDTDDRNEALRAFQEKRKPVFTGR